MPGKPVNLLEHGLLESAHNLRAEGGVLTALGDDPYLVFKPKRFIGFGCYLIDLDLEEISGDIRPRLYFHARQGFNQPTSELMRKTGPGHYRLYIMVSGKVKAIRLDPADHACKFRLRQFTIARAGVPTFFSRVMRNGENPGFEKPHSHRTRKALYRLAKYGISSERVDHVVRPSDTESKYQRWIKLYDFDDAHIPLYREWLGKLSYKPLISIVMPVFNTPAELLKEAIDSVSRQIYEKWELCIADDASSQPHVREILERAAKEDPRIKVVFREQNGHIAAATNSAFELATGEYIALLDHDDLLRPHALAEVVLLLNQKPDAELIYSDEDKVDSKGRRFDPFFKPNWNPQLLLGQNYLNHLTVHRADNIRKVGGWRSEYDGSQDFDLNLRITAAIDQSKIFHIPKILYHWRATENSAALNAMQKSYAVVNGGKALADYAVAQGIAGKVEPVEGTTWFRIRRALPDPVPRVSIIIPTRNGRDLLKLCIDSIYRLTDYPEFEIIVIDNNSDERESLAYLAEIEERGLAKVLRYPQPFNYSAINNFAVRHATGSLLLLLNNDVEVISGGWLREMVSLALLPGAGCVGAMLYYPNETIQHAGIVLGIGGVAGHSHKYFGRGKSGYFGRLKLSQNVSAVTGACLMVSKTVYELVGGLDEENLKIAFNDVDFCLRVREAGYHNLWTPFAELYHHESVSRGTEDTPERRQRFSAEVRHMMARWGDGLGQDPYYSPHLTLRREDYSLEVE